jgi:hypothetical protein
VTAEIIQLAHRSRKARVNLARSNPGAFNEFVLRDEKTNRPIKNAPFHYEWHDAYSRYPRTVLWSLIESGKTTGMTIGRTLFETGHNPDLRTVILQATEGKAKKAMGAIKRYIERSKELHEIFPNLVPSTPWTDKSLTVRRSSISKDPTIQARGVHGDIVGDRIDNLILDDVLRFENVRTKAEREKLIAWFNATLSGRLGHRSRIFAVGTAWHPEDLMHQLAKRPGWFHKRYPVIDENGRLRWPQRWPMERIERFKLDPGPLEFRRQLMCEGATEDMQRCHREWFERCMAKGNGMPMLRKLQGQLPPGAFTVTGVDLAAKKKRSALTVFFTILVLPPTWERRLLWIEAGQFTSPEIRDKAIATHRAFGSTLFVEDVGLQIWMMEMIEEKAPDVPVIGHQTGMNKWHPATGVETVFNEVNQGRWIIPAQLVDGRYKAHPEVEEWIGECVNFHPSQHTGDRCMASWFSKEGARLIAATMDEHEDDEVEIHGHGMDVHTPDPEDPDVAHWSGWGGAA